MNTEDRKFLERTLALENSLQSQPALDHHEWTNAGFICRILCHYGKLLVIWHETDDGPRVLGRIRITDLEATTREGVAVCIETSVRGRAEDYLWIGHKPQRIFGLPLFAHVPFICDIRHVPEERSADGYVTRFPLVFKSQSNPRRPVIGDTYITQLSEFRSTYPKFADLRL